MKKFEVKVLKSEGTCKNDLYETMATSGDLTTEKVINFVNFNVTIKGYAIRTITTDEKTFEITDIDTVEYGLISTGSKIFTESVEKYFGKAEVFKITKVKTKQGNTYKAVPVLGSKKEEIETIEDLPF